MSPLLLVSPVLLPMLGFIISLGFWKRPPLQRWINIVVSVSLVAVGATLVWAAADGEVGAVRLGDWPAPVAITFVVDRLAAVMILFAGVVATAASLYSLGGIDRRREAFGFHPLMLTLLAAVCGAFLTADLFNLYVWFEVMLLSSFVLLSLGGGRHQLEGAIKYVALNLLSSALFLGAIGLTYGMLGTLNMADLAEKLAAAEQPERFTPVAAVFITAFSIKAAAFPFFFWLPASYHTPPAIISAVFGALLTKVGVYVIIRFFSLMYPGSHPDAALVYETLGWIAGTTMLLGVLGAAVQTNMRRLLSFHIVSQIGYMLMGLAIAGAALAVAERPGLDEAERNAALAAATLALAGAVLHTLHNMIVKGGLFLVAGVVERTEGADDLNRVGGLYKSRPGLAAIFFVLAMSLAGIPVLSGFWSKVLLVKAGLEAQAYGLIATSLLVSVVTLFSMTKIWMYAFWKPAPEPSPIAESDRVSSIGTRDPRSGRGLWAMYAGCLILATGAVVMGAFAAPIVDYVEAAAANVIDPRNYFDAALDRPQRLSTEATP